MRVRISTALLAGAVALCGLPAQAASTVFLTRAAFVTATGPMTIEGFGGVVGEPSFVERPLTVGLLTLSTFGPQLGGGFVDRAPHQFDSHNINGTPNISVTTSLDGGFEITFDRAITAFGATFGDMQDRAIRTRLQVGDETLTPPMQDTDGVTFFGFIATSPFRSIRFLGNAEQDAFALDDLQFGDPSPVSPPPGQGEGGGAPPVTAVPEPAAWALMLVGAGFAGAALRRRRHYAQAPG